MHGGRLEMRPSACTTMHRSAAAALIVACGLLAVVRGEEGAAAAPGDLIPTTVAGFAGYTAYSDVDQHARVDRDIRSLEKAGDDWDAAKTIYEEGLHSTKSSGEKRTLKSFSTKWASTAVASEQSEPLVRLSHEFWGRGDYADAHILAALDGRDLEGYGMYGSGKLAKQAAARKQMVKKVVKFSAVWLYALHEVESAVAKYKDESLGDARFGADGAAHALDEGWVFYAGSLEHGSQEDGEADDSGMGYAPYVLAEKRAPAFKTDGYVLGNGGTSRVNLELLYQFTAMQRLLRTAGNEAQVEQSLKCIRAQFKIPVIQACLLYSHKASSPDLTDDDSLAKIKAEAWAFCSQALPLLHEVDPASAAAVKKTVMLDASDARPDWAIVRDAFSGENVNGMGLKCSDVGALDDGVYQCRDTASLLSQNSYADSAVCGSVRMPNNPSSAAGTASSWIVVGLAAVLSVLGTH